MQIRAAYVALLALMAVVCSCAEPPVACAEDTGSIADSAVDTAVDSGSNPARNVLLCTDRALDIYATPPNLPAFSASERGRIVACAKDGILPKTYIEAAAKAFGHSGVVSAGAVQTWRIAYRTERDPGKAGIGSARVYAPVTGRRTDGFLVIAHGTTGLSDNCAPSLNLDWSNYLVLPAVAKGWVVVAPDYAGLGTAGVQGYFNTHDTGHSVLDAARAVDRLLPALNGKPFVVIGHSQGGGAALAAQALAPTYGPANRLRGAVLFAPGHTYMDRSDWVHIPSWKIGDGGYFYAMILYADFAAILGRDKATYAFTKSLRPQLTEALDHLCTYQFGPSINALAATLGDLLDDGFEAAVKSCQKGGACPNPVAQWIARNKAAIVPPSANGAPILALIGGKDNVTPMVNMRCLSKWLGGHKVQVPFCLHGQQTHASIVRKTMPEALVWAEQAIAGKTPATPCKPHKFAACPWF